MEKVRAGEEIVIRASTWNAFIDAANYVGERRQSSSGAGLRSGVGGGVVLAKNTSSADRARFAAMAITGVCVTPSANEDEFVSCAPVFECDTVTSGRAGSPFVVLLEPVAAGGVGRAAVYGVVPAKLSVRDASHGYAEPVVGSASGELQSAATGVARILWKEGGTGSLWALLQLGGAGGGASGDKTMICKVTGGSSSAGYSVTVYPNGRTDMGTVSYGTLFVPDLALDSEIPTGTWVVGHPTMTAVTGGED